MTIEDDFRVPNVDSLSIRERMTRRTPEEQEKIFNRIPLEYLQYDWYLNRRPDQTPPTDPYWDTWVLSAGRGAGKTRAGAEWVRECVRTPDTRVILMGRTQSDVRSSMTEGESGILSIYPADDPERPVYKPSLNRLEWPNGSKAFIMSADNAYRLRGLQAHYAWADEVGQWPSTWFDEYEGAETEEGDADPFDLLRMGVRLGQHPRIVVTTTPNVDSGTLKRIDTDMRIYPDRVRLNTMSLHANALHLSPYFLNMVVSRYQDSGMYEAEVQGRWPWPY